MSISGVKVNPLLYAQDKTMDSNSKPSLNSNTASGSTEIKSLAGTAFVESLFDGASVIPESNSIIDSIFKLTGETPLSELISSIANIQDTFMSLNMSKIRGQERETNEYAEYLQFPNKQIEELAASIVEPTDSNDEKMYKIEQWVVNNIEYISDMENYGQDEYWAKPTETIDKMSGDCEDGAYLIHSLGLNAGVTPDRLRTYGGTVMWQGQNGLNVGGHAWTAYKTEEDDQWRILDSSFFTTDKPFNERQGMEDDYKYLDDYFFVNLERTVDTPYSNAIKEPDKHEKGLAINIVV